MNQLSLESYHPKANLVTKITSVPLPKFPAVDGHNHLAEYGGHWDEKPVNELLDRLDAAGITRYVDLDGGWGEEILHRHLDTIKAKAPERFAVYGGVPWNEWAQHGDAFGEHAARRLRAQAARGAQGLKVWKKLGLELKDQNGSLVRVNDRRLDPVWAVCGELGLPVTIHVADPVAFFTPLDATNERWEELHGHEDWQFPSPPFPSFMSIMDDLADVVQRHANTTFIGAHVGCYAENLAWVSALLDRCPNFNVDISARIGELGRQPYTARKFFLRYADRILFGTDAGPDLDAYPIYYRFLETDDEYFNYTPGDIPLQGRWFIYGLNLPDDVLEKVYRKNAERLIFHVQE